MIKDSMPNCPMCGERLDFGLDKQFETLSEHVECRWNYDNPPFRCTFICTNSGYCQAHDTGWWSGGTTEGEWHSDGSVHIRIPNLSTSGYLLHDEKKKYNEDGVYNSDPNFHPVNIENCIKRLEEVQNKHCPTMNGKDST